MPTSTCPAVGNPVLDALIYSQLAEQSDGCWLWTGTLSAKG